MAEHAVIIHIPLSDDSFGTDDERAQLYELMDLIRAEVERQMVGEFDGNEFGGGECVLFAYGPDADALFAAIREVLVGWPLLPSGTTSVKRYGEADDPNAAEQRVSF